MSDEPKVRVSSMTVPVDYLSFVDPDVAKLYQGQNVIYFSWEPLIAQLIQQLRKDAAERWELRREPQSNGKEKP